MRLTISPSQLVTGLFLAGIVMGAGPAKAQVYCSQPVEPSCVDVGATEEDAAAIQRCEQTVDQYEREIETYLKCLAKQEKALRESVAEMRQKLKAMRTDNESG